MYSAIPAWEPDSAERPNKDAGPVYLPIKLHNFVTPDRESRRTPNMDSDVPIVLLFLTLDA
jgi:hypothetical protein